MKIGMGAILGAIGGIIALIGTFLPWGTVTLLGIPIGIPGWAGVGFLTVIFAILGLVLVLIPKKITAILALVFGVLALVFALLQYLGVSAVVALAQLGGGTGSMGVGGYISMLGCILLIVGGGMAYSAAGKMSAPMSPMPMAPPP